MRRDLEPGRTARFALKPDTRLALWMDLYKEAGMGPMPFYELPAARCRQPPGLARARELKERFTPQWNTAYRSLWRSASASARSAAGLDPVGHISDELSNHGEEGAKLGVELAKASRECRVHHRSMNDPGSTSWCPTSTSPCPTSASRSPRRR